MPRDNGIMLMLSPKKTYREETQKQVHQFLDSKYEAACLVCSSLEHAQIVCHLVNAMDLLVEARVNIKRKTCRPKMVRDEPIPRIYPNVIMSYGVDLERKE